MMRASEIVMELAETARMIIENKKDLETEKKYAGSFLLAVFNGNFYRALAHADFQNRNVLVNVVICKMANGEFKSRPKEVTT